MQAARCRAIGAGSPQEARLIAEYQSKCREESVSWSELERAVTKQVIDIADASLVTSTDNSVALRISGLLNYASYRELFLRADRLTVSRGDGQRLDLQHSSKWERRTGMRSNAGIKELEARPETSSEPHSSARDKSSSRRKGKMRDTILPDFPSNIKPRNWRKFRGKR